MATQSLGRDLSHREFFIQRWKQEHPAFVRVIEALPANGPDWPHPRSRSAGELVALLVSAQRVFLLRFPDSPIRFSVAPDLVGKVGVHTFTPKFEMQGFWRTRFFVAFRPRIWKNITSYL